MERLRPEFDNAESDALGKHITQEPKQEQKYQPLSEAELSTFEELIKNGYGAALNATSMSRVVAAIRELQGHVSVARSIAKTLVKSMVMDNYCDWCMEYNHDLQPGCNVSAAERFLEATEPKEGNREG